MKLKMQICQSSSWAKFIKFDNETDDEQKIRAAAVELARILGANLRIIDFDNNVLADWDQQQGWVEDPFNRNER